VFHIDHQVDLHKHNFDSALAENDEVLVQFYAPWSKRCAMMTPHLESVARSAKWGRRFLHARSDISDPRGYTSYLENWGILKLPTVILFRNGHAQLYPLDDPLELPSLEAWLQQTTEEPLPDRDAEETHTQKVIEASEMMLRKHRRETEQRKADLGLKNDASGNDEDDESEPEGKANVKEEAIRRAKKAAEAPAKKPEAHATPAAEGAPTKGGMSGRDASSEETSCVALQPSPSISDATFEQVVMDKTKDVFVLFFKPSETLCEGKGRAYGAFAAELAPLTTSVLAVRMDVRLHKSPFVFEDDELPVAMLFPAKDKRPLEFDDETFGAAQLRTFARENGSLMPSDSGTTGYVDPAAMPDTDYVDPAPMPKMDNANLGPDSTEP